MRAFHEYWALAVVVVNCAVGAWGLGFVRRAAAPPKAFWPAVYTGQGVLFVQVALGVILQQTITPPGRHVFYGFVLAIAAALVWGFRSADVKRTVTLYSLAALFVGVVGVRTMLTA